MWQGLQDALFKPPGQIFGVRSIIALLLTSSACLLWLTGEPVSDTHIQAMVGFDALYAGARFVEGKNGS